MVLGNEEVDYASAYEHLLVDVNDRVATVTINRPEQYNSVNHRLHQELVEIWRDLGRDPRVNVIVVTGAGEKAFSAGADLNMLKHRMSLTNEDRYVDTVTWEARDLVYGMVNCDKVIISAINGAAVGAGLAVAIMSDISIIADDARLGDGHVKLGVAAGDHSAMIWPLLCGLSRAKYYLLTGEMLDGKKAAEIGLVTQAVPRADVVSTASDLARRLADGSQQALSLSKRALNQWLRLGGLTAFDYSLAVEKMGFFSPDAQEGVTAMREKRAAVFPSASAEPAAH
ncbi:MULTISPECIES: enoyl-CoA hydratase/isomerase family protein [unclassified Microbacterium]|uniref:enoyl-CoA hydratase/isomerase family protein n=1 Tax=unclassified Microbacterium TaxID=2609290 RepID=UPI000C5F6604|nr:MULTISPECIES: enoyl-CoA hydratase/isomerase family protein [unclassified Microbacterium]MBU19021.1 enoyl-CoA hydratase [Microbacterium sp.]HBU41935.1 enoyl-CoA hydratase [Microbacterium sp.]|tara:strand:- start:18542 stop:19393 length:852 start_codon:yes stop_codon:yes gene_type:complete